MGNQAQEAKKRKEKRIDKVPVTRSNINVKGGVRGKMRLPGARFKTVSKTGGGRRKARRNWKKRENQAGQPKA